MLFLPTFVLEMLSALNDDLPDDLLSGWDGGNNAANNSNGTMSNGNVDQMGPQQMGPGGMMPAMRGQPGMMTSMQVPGGQNMALVNALNKSKANGPTGAGGMGGAPTSVVPPHSLNDNNSMTTINSSMQSSSIGGHPPPGQMQMAPMNTSGDMNNTMQVSMHSQQQQQGMQMQRPMMGQQTIIPSGQPGMPNGPAMVRHVNQMGMQRGGMLSGQPRMLPGPGVRMQNMVSFRMKRLLCYKFD